MKIVTTSLFRIAISRQVPDNCMTPSYPLMTTGSSVVCPSWEFFKVWHEAFQRKAAQIGLRTDRANKRRNPCGLFSSEAVNYLNHSVALTGDDYVAAMFQARIRIHPDAQILGIPPARKTNEQEPHCNCVIMFEDEQLFFYEPQQETLSLMPFGDAINYCDVYDVIV